MLGVQEYVQIAPELSYLFFFSAVIDFLIIPPLSKYASLTFNEVKRRFIGDCVI